MTYKAIILKMLDAEPHKWFYAWELEKVNTPWGWVGLRGSRDCRELAARGDIEANHDEKLVRYRQKPLHKIVEERKWRSEQAKNLTQPLFQ